MKQQRHVSADNILPPVTPQLSEITLRVIILALLLTVLLAASNAYLALKIGILTSASIPAAVISMGILRFFRTATILENNLVQTAASAGEAVAGGIVYTVPALIIIGYWQEFNYWESLWIALLGGILGVLFSVPLRQFLVSDRNLSFPEGRAIAELLKTSAQQAIGMNYMIQGGIAGAVLELFQSGFKIIATSWEWWVSSGSIVMGFGAGFSATMIGAGYLIGFEIACSILLGAIIGWGCGVPLASSMFPYVHDHTGSINVSTIVTNLWNSEIRYVGIGSMLFAGIWTLFAMIKPMLFGINTSLQLFTQSHTTMRLLPRTQQDIPLLYNLIVITTITIGLIIFFYNYLPITELQLSGNLSFVLIVIAVLYIIVVGFIFSGICGYFSGLVGVSASPGSAIIIAGILLISLILLGLFKNFAGFAFTEHQLKLAEAMAIIIGSVITSIACIANDNIQDLKVGYILGATPWKQQIMLLFGVIIASLVIPPVMQLLFNVYGIAGIMPHSGMNPAISLSAPPAAMIAAITQAVFHKSLPWHMLLIGIIVIMVIIIINCILRRVLKLRFMFSILGVAIGIYLPLASSIPLFIGGFMAWIANQRIAANGVTSVGDDSAQQQRHYGILLACGLVAGAALMDVVLAIPFSIMHSPNALNLTDNNWHAVGVMLGAIVWVVLGCWFYHASTNKLN